MDIVFTIIEHNNEMKDGISKIWIANNFEDFKKYMNSHYIGNYFFELPYKSKYESSEKISFAFRDHFINNGKDILNKAKDISEKASSYETLNKYVSDNNAVPFIFFDANDGKAYLGSFLSGHKHFVEIYVNQVNYEIPGY